MKAEKRVLRYGSVCSGIEAATAAWHGLGWQPSFFSEIEAFPRAVLAHHYPDVPLHGDFTTIPENEYEPIDLLVGGTPCQSFSVAGLRGGLDDDRGNLALEFCRLAQRLRPRWIVWENVPGVLSSGGGRDFGSILGALEDLGYGLAYRVLDAQYFGVAQRRRRVFVVGYLGDWRRAAAVLFERHSMSGHPAPRREARKDAARAIASGAEERSGCGGDGSSVDWRADVACILDTDFASKWGQNNQHVNAGCPLFVPDSVGTLRTRRPGEGGVQGDFDHIVPVVSPALNTQSGSHHAPDTKACVAYAVTPFDTTQISSPHNYSNPQPGDPCHPLAAGAHAPAIAFAQNTRDEVRLIGGDGEIAGALAAQPGMKQTTYIAFSSNMSVPDCQTDGSTPTLKLGGHGGGNPPAVAYPINTQMALRGADTSNTSREGVGIGGENDPAFTLQAGHCHAVAFSETARTLSARHDGSPCADRGPDVVAVAFGLATPVTPKWWEELSPTLTQPSPTGGGQPAAVAITSAVRRLTPVECERLQGFPDNFTAIPWKKKGPEQCPDGPRYKALGNSMAVPVMRWIGERIAAVDAIKAKGDAA